MKKGVHESIKSILCYHTACIVEQQIIFPLTFLLLPVYFKKLFLFLTSFNSSWALAFLIVSAYLDCVSISLLASPSSLPLLCTSLCLRSVRSSSVICAGPLSCLLYFLLVKKDWFFTLRKLSLKIKQHTWVPLGSQDKFPLWNSAETFIE